MEKLTSEFDEIYMDYKLIYDDVIESCSLEFPDFEPYFLEPIKYKEVEWIEFPNEYEVLVNKNNFKAGHKTKYQNCNGIKYVIENLGEYKMDVLDNFSIRVYAYI